VRGFEPRPAHRERIGDKDASTMPDSYLKRSFNTEYAMTAVRPRLRGRSHQVAGILGLPIAIASTLRAPAGQVRLAVASFAFGVTIMLLCSGMLHLRRWDAIVHERLLRLDHSGIYCAIGGSTAAIALLALEDWPMRVLLLGTAVGSAIGIVLEWLPFAAPRGVSNTVYITLGWLPVLLLPWVWVAAGPLVVVLIIAGGVLYTSGAIIVALRRPDVLPGWFGYHELFHVLVIGAVLLHAWAVGRLVILATGSPLW
jgi:hemolysin III